uniref:BTB domain-containing protein n=1 Tax=Panagrolaimus sp. PS1159 TaxID=55785 RepID=A0AC35FUZ8_9BILA
MDQTLVKAMEDMFISKNGADVTFIVHGKEIKAHKFIVSTRSYVFETMIEGVMAPEDQRHVIDDPKITAEDFEKFLKFLYIDKNDDPFQKADVKAMIYLGWFYDIPFLLKKCAERIGLLSAEDAYEFAEMTLEYLPETTDLFQKCLISVIVNHYEAPMNYRNAADGTVKWISEELVLEIVKRRSKDGRLSENALFQKVFKWAKNACALKNRRYPTPDDIQEIMLPLMPYFVISELSPLTMATKVKTNKLIPLEDLVNHLADHIVDAFDEDSNRGRLDFRGGKFKFKLQIFIIKIYVKI